MTAFADELLWAIRTATRIGHLIRNAGPAAATEKGDGTPQTAVDVAGNQLFHEAVAAERPASEYALGEEDVATLRTFPPDARVWVCDPADGSWLLPYGLPYTVVSIGLVAAGLPAVGVVYDPHTGRLFTGADGVGAHLNGVPLRVNSVSSVRKAVLALPGGKVDSLRTASLLADAVSSGAELMTVGSVVHDATLVACGFAAGMIYPYNSPWDLAGIVPIVTGAGGLATALDGSSQRYDGRIRGAVLSNGTTIHDDLVDLAKRWRT